jgi:hypothetical protein
MTIQGLDKLLLAAAEKVERTKPEKGKTGRRAPERQEVDTETSGSPDRAELMLSVKQKIKSGYYNSESVLDDLSHGFASALNSL